MTIKPKPKQTIYDVAQAAGASPSTVSSALNGTWKRRRIAEETVERIRRIAAEQGYSVNLQARGLRKARSGLVGMILPEHDNRFFSSLSQEFATACRARGHCPAIVLARRDPKEERKSVETLMAYAVDALMIVGSSEPESLSRICREAGLAHVFVDQPCKAAPSVVSDNFAGARALALRLMDRMEKDGELYFLGGDARLHASRRRIEGFRAALAERGRIADKAQIIACGYEPQAVRRELHALRDRLGGLPNGLLINSIGAFEGVLGLLGDLPEEEIARCAIGCYDYDPFGILLRFPVDMIRQRAAALIERAYDFLDAEDETPSLTLIEPELLSPVCGDAPSSPTK